MANNSPFPPHNILHCPVEAYPSLTSGGVRWGVSIGFLFGFMDTSRPGCIRTVARLPWAAFVAPGSWARFSSVEELFGSSGRQR